MEGGREYFDVLSETSKLSVSFGEIGSGRNKRPDYQIN